MVRDNANSRDVMFTDAAIESDSAAVHLDSNQHRESHRNRKEARTNQNRPDQPRSHYDCRLVQIDILRPLPYIFR